MNNFATLIPVKAFDSAKERLSTVLESSGRAELARTLATGVIEACSGLSVWVVCEDNLVESWARNLGVNVIRNPDAGLNEAVSYGFTSLKQKGFERVLISHGDLKQPRGLPSLFEIKGIVIVPDSKLDGTNVLVLPTDIEFTFSYGRDSYTKHLDLAERTGLPVSTVKDSKFSFDLDEPDDLDEFNVQDDSSV